MRAGRAHFDVFRRPVDIDIAAHGINVAETVPPQLATGQPQDAREDPVAPGMFPLERCGPRFPGRPAPHEDRVLGSARPDFGPDQVSTARCLKTAEYLAHTSLAGGNAVFAQHLPVFVKQGQQLAGNRNLNFHVNFRRRSAKKADSTPLHSSARTPPTTVVW